MTSIRGIAHGTARPVRLALLLAALAVAGCASGGSRTAVATDGRATSPDAVSLTVLQMNDVYEMTPVAGGAQGGLARVATVRKELLRRNPNTITVLAGDLFNPSAMGRARVDGKALNGRQIVDVMNALGLDYATFGNHEFDLPHEDFLARLSESTARWFSSNVLDAGGRPFPGVPAHVVFEARNAAGRSARVGLFGLTTPDNPRDYVRYTDVMEAARRQVAELRPRVDILIAVTHLPVGVDAHLVEALPEIDLVIGGHEHEDMLLLRGPRLTPIAKADANARTVYIHELEFHTGTRALTVESRPRKITAEVPDDPAVAAVVARWVDRAFAAFRSEGFEPTSAVARVTEPLDGAEASVRNRSTRLTDLIAWGMLAAVPGAEWSVYNSGAIRIDDVILPGPVTEYDVIRILPFGGAIVRVEMKGALLQRVLEQGQRNKGIGGYLHSARARSDGIEPDRRYVVAIADFLLTGREAGLAFLADHPDTRRLPGAGVDMRRALIDQLRRAYPDPARR
jgi:5'-nucleotidase